MTVTAPSESAAVGHDGGSNDAFRRLLRRVDLGLLTVAADDATLDAVRPWAEPAAVLGATAAARTVRCPGCEGFVGTVRSERDGDGRRVLLLPCPDCGIVPIDAGMMGEQSIHVEALITAVGAALGPGPPPARQRNPAVWRLGLVAAASGAVEILLGVGDPRRWAAEAVRLRAKRRAGLVLTLTAHGLADWPADLAVSPVALADLLSFTDGRLHCDLPRLFGLARAEAPSAPPKRRPRKKRADRLANINALIGAMEDHLDLARAHAETTRHRDGVAELLPPPGQAELARRLGFDESTVSRCFNDNGPLTRLLHELMICAYDIDRVLQWTRPPK